MPYFVTPRAVNVITTRSKAPYDDRLIIQVQLHTSDTAPHPEDLSKKPNETIEQQRAAHLGFLGDHMRYDLKDDDWGLNGGWRIPISTDPEINKHDQWLEVVVTNVRNVPDDYIWTFVKAFSAVGTIIATAEEPEIAASVATVAEEYGLGGDLVGLVEKGIDVVKGVLGPSNVPCVGPVFRASIQLNPEKIDQMAFNSGDINSDTAVETSIRNMTLTATLPVGDVGECQQPAVTVELAIERNLDLIFPPAPHLTTNVSALPFVRSYSLTGTWVDEASQTDALHSVLITISMPPANVELLNISVTETDVTLGTPVQILHENFEGIDVTPVMVSAPGQTYYARQQPSSPIAGPGHGIPIGPRVSTSVLSMRYGDCGESYIGVWHRLTQDEHGQPLVAERGLFYQRRNYSGLTNTSVWLVPPKPIR